MQDCIFCQIIKGELPSYKVFEDDKFFAFLDIYPKTQGHTLVVPKKHYEWVYDLSKDEFKEYWERVYKITKAVQKAFNPHFISYLTYGLDVPHAHVHIIPYYKAVSPIEAVSSKESFSKEEMEKIAEQIRKAI